MSRFTEELCKNVYGEVKFMGDPYFAGYSAGMSMLRSGTMNRFKPLEEKEDYSTYVSEDGFEMRVDKKIDGDLITVNTSIENKGDKEAVMELISSFAIKDLSFDNVYRMQSFWSAEGKLKKESVTDLHIERSWSGGGCRIEKFGNVGTMPVRKYFPFLCVEDKKTGNFIGVQLYLASSWQLEMLLREKETYTLAGGIADRDFGHWTKTLKPGEKFEAPKAVIATGTSLLDVCDKLVKAQHPAISEYDRKMSIMFNEYCTTWGNPSYENVVKIADKIAGKGIDFLVIDSGWYGDVDEWWDMIGDWHINQKRFPGGMKKIADYIRSKGMIPGLWYEFESIASKAPQYNDNDHVVKKDGYPLMVADRKFWDMENPEVTEYLDRAVIDNLKDSGFGYVKVDYNETMGMGCDGPEGMGENLRKKVIASQNYFKRIAEKIPGIVIENCSSGGHRLEPSMMELVSQASFSDAHETKAIPLIAANLQRVIKPEQSQIWAVMRAKDDDNRLFYSLCNTFLGRMCLSGDIYDLNDHQWGIIEDAMNFYRRVSEIIRSGKTTVMEATPESYNHPEGNQLVVRELENRKLVIFHRFENSKSFEEFAKGLLDLEGYKETKRFGKAEDDFSALAIEYSK